MSLDHTTLRETIDELLMKLRAELVADPPTSAAPFRRIAVGETSVTEYPRPFLAVELVRARSIGTTDGDKLTEVTASLRIVTDVLAADAHGELLDRVAAVDDFFDGLLEEGLIDGASGFDDRVWTFAEPKLTAGARVATATATETFVVRVERGQNRLPSA